MIKTVLRNDFNPEEYRKVREAFLQNLRKGPQLSQPKPKIVQPNKKLNAVNLKADQVESLYKSGDITDEEFELLMEQLDAEYDKL